MVENSKKKKRKELCCAPLRSKLMRAAYCVYGTKALIRLRRSTCWSAQQSQDFFSHRFPLLQVHHLISVTSFGYQGVEILLNLMSLYVESR